MEFAIHRTKSLPALIIILGCPKLTRYLLTLKDDLHQLHAYLSISESATERKQVFGSRQSKLDGQMSEKTVEISNVWTYSRGTLQFPSKCSMPDLKAKDSLVLAKKAANSFFLLSRTTIYDLNYSQHISCLGIMYAFTRYVS